MLTRSTVLACALGGLCLAVATEAGAQSLRGQSIQIDYSAGRFVYNNLFYISRDNRVFDYASNQQGGEFRSGQWKDIGQSSHRFIVSGRSLISENRNRTGQILRTVITTYGGTCSVTQSGPNALPITFRSCRVVNGRLER